MKKIKDYFLKFWDWFKSWTYKEEAIAAILIALGFIFVNYILTETYPPEAGFFNLPSQFETLVYVVLKFVLMILLAWMGLRIVLPPVYRFIRNDVYQNFADLPAEVKRDWALRLIMTFLLCAAVATTRAQTGTRANLTKLVYSQVGIHEIKENSSPEIAKFLSHVGVYKPAPWCVAFVSFDLSAVGVANPRSAWSPDYAKPKDIIWTPKNPRLKPLAGDVITIYYAKLKRVGHGCFFIREDTSGYFITGEGNANQKLSRTGGEVCILKRDPEKIYAITRYIK